MATPDKSDPGIRVVQCARVVSTSDLTLAISLAGILLQLVREVLAEVPGADFIEIRAIRYDVKEEGDERSVSPVPPGE